MGIRTKFNPMGGMGNKKYILYKVNSMGYHTDNTSKGAVSAIEITLPENLLPINPELCKENIDMIDSPLIINGKICTIENNSLTIQTEQNNWKLISGCGAVNNENIGYVLRAKYSSNFVYTLNNPINNVELIIGNLISKNSYPVIQFTDGSLYYYNNRNYSFNLTAKIGQVFGTYNTDDTTWTTNRYSNGGLQFISTSNQLCTFIQNKTNYITQFDDSTYFMRGFPTNSNIKTTNPNGYVQIINGYLYGVNSSSDGNPNPGKIYDRTNGLNGYGPRAYNPETEQYEYLDGTKYTDISVLTSINSTYSSSHSSQNQFLVIYDKKCYVVCIYRTASNILNFYTHALEVWSGGKPIKPVKILGKSLVLCEQ